MLLIAPRPFFHQMRLGRRRELTRLEETPVWSALQLRSEMDLAERAAVGCYLQLALKSARLGAKQLFEMINREREPLLYPEDLYGALTWLGIAPESEAQAREAVWRWLQAAGSDAHQVLSLDAF